MNSPVDLLNKSGWATDERFGRFDVLHSMATHYWKQSLQSGALRSVSTLFSLI